MKINNIITESLLFEQQLKEDPIYKNFYSAGKMLVEYKMSQEQIKQLFKSVADGAAAGGNIDKEGDAPASNRTLLGKGADVANTISKAFDSVKTKISQSGPVSGFDVAFDNLQSKLLNAAGGDKGAVGKALAKYREFAHKHPVMQGAVYSGLIALAGISGAGLGGAALLGGIKVFDKLLQGDKASSALWSGLKTGGMAYGAGQLGQALKGGGQMAPANPDDFGATTAGDAGGIAGQFDGGQYTVVKGDTLGHIAQANGVSVEDLRGLNPQIDFAKPIQPGMSINLPQAGDNAGSVWQGYRGGMYGDQVAGAAKGAGDMATQQNFVLPADSAANNEIVKAANAQAWLNADAAERLDIEQTTGMSAEKLQNIVDTNKLQPGTSPNDAALDIRSRLNTGPGPVPSQPDVGLDTTDTSSLTNTSSELPQIPKGAKMSAEYLKRVISGQQPRPMISPEDAQAALDWQAQNGGQAAQAASTAAQGAGGYSKEYLQKVINGEVPRPMISVDKAKQLLNQSYVNTKPMLEYIDRDATVRSWVLRESVGKPRGGVALTEAGRQAVFRAVSEGPWDDIKQGAGKFVKGLGQGFTNPGVRNIKNLDTSQMAGAQVGAAGNKLAKGYGKLAGMVQRGADAVGGVVKKGWDSAANKITYDKLDLNWRKSYKEFDPTGGKGSVDSEVVADFLRKQGVKDGLISSVYKQLGIPFGGAQQSQPAQDQAQQGQQQGQPAPVQQPQQGQSQRVGSTQTSTQATAADPTAPDANNMANRALGGNPEGGNNLTRGGLAGVIKGAQGAWERGARGPGEAWGSLADTGTGKTVKLTGNDNKTYQYTKQGTQWIDAQGNPVSDPAQIAMLNKQSAGQKQPAQATQAKTTTAPATTTTAPKQEPITIGGQKIMPSDPAYAKIMKGVSTGAAPAASTETPPAVTTQPAATPAVKKRTGGKVAGQLSQTPSAIRRRQARAAASSAKQGKTAPAATTVAPTPKFGPGVTPQTSVAPSKVSYNMNLPKAASVNKAVQTAGKIDRRPAVNEQIDIAEALWRKMKSKR